MFKDKYIHMNEQIVADEELIASVLLHSKDSENRKNFNKHPNFIKAAVFILVIFSAVFTFMPSLAANNQYIYNLMYGVSPSVAQFFIPVEKSSSSNGIVMEVVSSYIHDDTAEIYISMTDTIETRIDGTTDLFDSYSIRSKKDLTATCELMTYDNKLNKATFLIKISTMDGSKIDREKITFSVREFISGKKIYEDTKISLDGLSIDSKAIGTERNINGAGGIKSIDFDRKWTVLKPNSNPSKLVDGIDISAVAFLDDKLHIQTVVYNNLENDNHGYFYLKNISSGQIINYDYSLSFMDNPHTNNRVDYDEFVFDISEDDFKDYDLYGNFYTSTSRTNGDWRVVFGLER